MGIPRFILTKEWGVLVWLAMMINEPTRKKPNCIFKCDHVVVAQPIKEGEELTVYYGNAYDVIRKLKGYNLDNNRYLEAPHNSHDFRLLACSQASLWVNL